MIQLKILTGKQAGTAVVARRFPFRVGRGNGCDLLLDDPGVWDRHLELGLTSDNAIRARRMSDALLMIEGQNADEKSLRNGDLIELGSVKIRFGLAEARLRSVAFREALTWGGIMVLCLFQVVLIYWLLL
jgi:hypothetical protein